MAFQKLLCAVDFSPIASTVLRAAMRFAHEAGGSLTIAHVVEPVFVSPEPMAAAGKAQENALRRADLELAQVGVEAQEAVPGVRVDVTRLEGTPWRRLVDLAESQAFELIVTGTRGRTGFKHLLGSVAERVVRHAACPVLVVREMRLDDAPLFKSILCAVDFSDPSRAAMRAAVGLSRVFKTALTLVHVYEIPIYVERPERMPDAVERDIGVTKRTFAEWQDEARRAVPEARGVWIEAYTPWWEIVRAAESYGHDLIIVGTRGRTGLRRALIGSVAERVVRHASCSVMTVHAPQD
jgi:nucleotide-binding universal stress UspA family protein